MKEPTKINRHQDVRLEVSVLREEERKRFGQLLKDHHYLGQTPPVGDFLCQVIRRDGRWVGLLLWGPAALKLKGTSTNPVTGAHFKY